jgi:penicillin amidase
VLSAAALAIACDREPAVRPPLAPPLSGTIELPGLSARVRVVRDRWGIPHLYAQSQRDLFVAQGFVQAEDRLFQMDLWRRSVQGRLSEVLGPNFIERDAMTRRVQYRGDLAREWASYGPDARSIAAAFVDGINAWVAMARERPAPEFVLAGWRPDPWTAEDLLNRTDGFDVRAAVDLVTHNGMNDIVADAVRRIGAAPFFTLLTGPVAPVRRGAGAGASDRELVSPLALIPMEPGDAAVDDATLTVSESRRSYQHPSPRYLVHLHAPGWNAAGATAPWRPGVAIGHNDDLAWGLVPSAAEAADVVEQPADPASTRVLTESIVVKGRAKAFEFQTQLTPEGVVIASDRQRGREFVLRWVGFDAGAAPELAALAIDRARTSAEFTEAASRWKLPAVRFVLVQRGTPQPRGPEGGIAPKERGRTEEREARPVARAMFAHPLAITPNARDRFDVGPLPRPPHDQQFQARFVASTWDQSRVVNAPGQSESPDSPHFADMAAAWSAGDMVPFVFSDAAVQANTEAVLLLVPAKGGR